MFIIPHNLVIKNLVILFILQYSPFIFAFTWNKSIMQHKQFTNIQKYNTIVYVSWFLDKWLLATSIIQREKQWKYRGIAFVYVYFFLSCQSFLLDFL